MTNQIKLTHSPEILAVISTVITYCKHCNYIMQSVTLHRTSSVYVHFWKWVACDDGCSAVTTVQRSEEHSY